MRLVCELELYETFFDSCVYHELKYNITCIQRPLKVSNESGLLQQVMFKYRFY